MANYNASVEQVALFLRSATDKTLKHIRMEAIRNNTHQQRFELETEGKLSIVDYQMMGDDTLELVHTEVDPSLEGHGIGSKLVESVLQYVEQKDLKIVPLCPFVTAYLKRHPDWNRIVSTDYTATGF